MITPDMLIHIYSTVTKAGYAAEIIKETVAVYPSKDLTVTVMLKDGKF